MKTKTKKIRLFKIATELNIGKETIVEFLRSRGYDIGSSPSTVLTPEMVTLVLDHFESERRAASRVRKAAKETPPGRESVIEEVPQPVAPSMPEMEQRVEKEQSRAVSDKEQSTVPAVEHEEPVTLEVKILGKVDLDQIEPSRGRKSRRKTKEATKKGVKKKVQESVPKEEGREVAVQDSATEGAEIGRPEMTQQSVESEAPISEGTVPISSSLQDAEKDTTDTEEQSVPDVEEQSTDYSDTEIAAESEEISILSAPPVSEIDPDQFRDEVSGVDELTVTEGEEADIDEEAAEIPQRGRIDTRRTFRRRRKRGKRIEVDQEAVEQTVRKTLGALSTGEAALSERRRSRRQRKKQRKEERLQEQEQQKQRANVLEIPEFITLAELATVMDVQPSELITKCVELGMMVSINQRLDRDVISLLAEEKGFEVHFTDVPVEQYLEEEEEDRPEDLQDRPPVVTIMGHVDHGKTSLLDYIRQSNVVAGEAGGITQHIGAYRVELPQLGGKSITFLDTPGHEAFTAMRARGAQVTDIVVLVVAADDRVMPQTEEAISHARVANVPIIVAINKIDKPEANPDLIKQQLSEKGLLVEEWGGEVPCVEVSAKTGQGVDQLLETILLVAEIQELKANPNRRARGTVIESRLDRGKGPVATVLIQQGTLREGDVFVCGTTFGKVRAMLDERGNRVKQATPSTPVQVLGFDAVPEAGDQLLVVDSESKARTIARQRQILKQEQLAASRPLQMNFENLATLIREHAVRELPIVLKADVMGSLEALSEALYKLSTAEVTVKIIHRGIGAISESDVMLAAASNAVVIGFHVRPTSAAKQAAEREGVEIRIYRVIYECIDDVRQALEGMLQPEVREEIVGVAEVREVFRIRKVGTVAGCYVREGVVHRNDNVRLIRDGVEIFSGSIRSLRRHKEDVREVKSGYECGILLDGWNDIQVGDEIEAVQIVEVKRSLETAASSS